MEHVPSAQEQQVSLACTVKSLEEQNKLNACAAATGKATAEHPWVFLEQTL